MKKPTTIAEYINSAPKEAHERLHEMYDCLRKSVPDAKESIKWGQPAFSHDWILFQFAAFKNHISLYPTPSVVETFKKELENFHTSSSTIQFPLDKPLPVTLISKIAAFRIEESKKGVKWM